MMNNESSYLDHKEEEEVGNRKQVFPSWYGQNPKQFEKSYNLGLLCPEDVVPSCNYRHIIVIVQTQHTSAVSHVYSPLLSAQHQRQSFELGMIRRRHFKQRSHCFQVSTFFELVWTDRPFAFLNLSYKLRRVVAIRRKFRDTFPVLYKRQLEKTKRTYTLDKRSYDYITIIF